MIQPLRLFWDPWRLKRALRTKSLVQHGEPGSLQPIPGPSDYMKRSQKHGATLHIIQSTCSKNRHQKPTIAGTSPAQPTHRRTIISADHDAPTRPLRWFCLKDGSSDIDRPDDLLALLPLHRHLPRLRGHLAEAHGGRLDGIAAQAQAPRAAELDGHEKGRLVGGILCFETIVVSSLL